MQRSNEARPTEERKTLVPTKKIRSIRETGTYHKTSFQFPAQVNLHHPVLCCDSTKLDLQKERKELVPTKKKRKEA